MGALAGNPILSSPTRASNTDFDLRRKTLMNAYLDQLPVVIGVGQVVDYWDGEDLKTAPNPVSLMAEAVRTALADTGQARAVLGVIDVVCVLRTTEDSVPMTRFPFAMCKNIPRAVSKETGLSPERFVYSAVGGEQPQALVNEWAKSLYEGDTRAVLLTGGEANSAMKLAMKNGHSLDWPFETEGDMEDWGGAPDFITPYEIKNGVGMPPRTYALLEKAYRHRLGMQSDDYRHMASELLNGFSKVAAKNPYSQFPEEKSTEFLETESADNFKVSDVYLKWHMAQDSVNQGAALILTTAGQARELGVDPSKWVYLHGHATLKERMVSERADISHSGALREVLAQTMETSSVLVSQIEHFEIYSCFPVLVFIAAEYLGMDWRTYQFTQTGGLPFFGGPGNNYSAHGIASLVDRLRQEPGARGLVLANGGFMSKFAAAVYSTEPPKNWSPADLQAAQNAIDNCEAPTLLEEDCEAVIQSYVVSHHRGKPNHAFVIAEAENGRVLAQVRPGDEEMLNLWDNNQDMIGQTVHIEHKNGQNLIASVSV